MQKIDRTISRLRGDRPVPRQKHRPGGNVDSGANTAVGVSTIVDKFRQPVSTKNRENPSFCPLWRLGHDGARAREIGKRIEAIEKPLAEERQQSSLKEGMNPREGNFPERDKGQTRDKVAEALGVSGKTYEKAKQVVEAAEDTTLPEPVREVAREAVTSAFGSSARTKSQPLQRRWAEKRLGPPRLRQ